MIAAGVIPAIVHAVQQMGEHNNNNEGSGASSGSDKGAVSGTSSESENDYDGYAIKDLS